MSAEVQICEKILFCEMKLGNCNNETHEANSRDTQALLYHRRTLIYREKIPGN
jgi:hypothetical protein